MIFEDLRDWTTAALKPWAREQGLEGLPPFLIQEPPPGVEADAACNLALLLAKPLKKSPRAVAESIQKALTVPSDLVGSVTIAGAGFLNFTWSPRRLAEEMDRLRREGDAYGRDPSRAKTRVLIEFVSANPTGPLHVGHGRGAAMGDSLAWILRHLGHPVEREYYINDAGHQVQLLAESLRGRVRELQGKPLELPEEGYRGDYLVPVARAFIKAHPDAADDLESLRQFALAAAQKNIEADLRDFGVTFERWFSEDSLLRGGRVEACVETLKKVGAVQEYDGAVWFTAGSKAEDGRPADKDRVLKRRDGRWTYFATDVAYHADKFARGYDRMIDIWGADHHGYVARVKGSMEALGCEPDQLHIVLYQLVSLSRGGQPVSMSKRSGDFITLREVLDEVGRDACRFFFAMRSPNTAFEFDLELAKKQTNDNPVFYLQYAHARICSIFRQAGEAALAGAPDWSILGEKEERELIKRLALFPQSLQVCAQEDSPHPLATYLLALCRQFHYFYDHHRVLGVEPSLTRARLALLQGVRQVLKLGLKLLGVSAPESM